MKNSFKVHSRKARYWFAGFFGEVKGKNYGKNIYAENIGTGNK